MDASNGRFVWFDLMTTDIKGAESFYSDVVGWQPTKWAGGDYVMWKAGDDEVGGVVGLPRSARKAGPSPEWLAYVGTDDVDAIARKAEQLGGKVVVPARDIPSIGRYAILVDRQGADFAVFQALDSTGAAGGDASEAGKLGHFSWAELNTTDWKSAWAFYSNLFGWLHTASMDMGPEYGEYFMFGFDEKDSIGGMSNSAPLLKTRPHWLHYVNVKSADETVEKVVQMGGRDLNGLMDVPGGGRIAQCVDPQGARFAIYSSQVEAT